MRFRAIAGRAHLPIGGDSKNCSRGRRPRTGLTEAGFNVKASGAVNRQMRPFGTGCCFKA